MEDKLVYFDLCGALSDIFVDNEVDFKYISSIAKKFPVTIVEEILFEWVAPVCYTNLLTPAPSVWSGFDKKLYGSIFATIEIKKALPQNANINCVCLFSK
ncbi:DUF7079 family protein [Pectobacterium odoriferum]|uniref:DUF7079 family protein n=1 Tax=Pectobacterium odoriferum TaxID=78398 RepID=UPI0021641490|nr:hypothetical protein [Pectobacterium odoriferum]